MKVLKLIVILSMLFVLGLSVVQAQETGTLFAVDEFAIMLPPDFTAYDLSQDDALNDLVLALTQAGERDLANFAATVDSSVIVFAYGDLDQENIPILQILRTPIAAAGEVSMNAYLEAARVNIQANVDEIVEESIVQIGELEALRFVLETQVFGSPDIHDIAYIIPLSGMEYTVIFSLYEDDNYDAYLAEYDASAESFVVDASAIVRPDVTSGDIDADSLGEFTVYQGNGLTLELPSRFEGGSGDDLVALVPLLEELGPEFAGIGQALMEQPDVFVFYAFDPELTPSGSMTNVNVTRFEVPENISIEVALNLIIANLPFEIIESETETLDLNGFEAGRMTHGLDLLGLRQRQIMYLIRDGGFLWQIVYTTSDELFAQWQPLFDKSARTFSINRR